MHLADRRGERILLIPSGERRSRVRARRVRHEALGAVPDHVLHRVADVAALKWNVRYAGGSPERLVHADERDAGHPRPRNGEQPLRLLAHLHPVVRVEHRVDVHEHQVAYARREVVHASHAAVARDDGPLRVDLLRQRVQSAQRRERIARAIVQDVVAPQVRGVLEPLDPLASLLRPEDDHTRAMPSGHRAAVATLAAGEGRAVEPCVSDEFVVKLDDARFRDVPPTAQRDRRLRGVNVARQVRLTVDRLAHVRQNRYAFIPAERAALSRRVEQR